MLKNYFTFYTCNQHINKLLPAATAVLPPLPLLRLLLLLLLPMRDQALSLWFWSVSECVCVAVWVFYAVVARLLIKRRRRKIVCLCAKAARVRTRFSSLPLCFTVLRFVEWSFVDGANRQIHERNVVITDLLQFESAYIVHSHSICARNSMVCLVRRSLTFFFSFFYK